MGKSKDWLDSLNSKGPEALKTELDSAQPWTPPKDEGATCSDEPETIPQILAACGFDKLQAGTPVEAIEPVLRALASGVSGADRLRRAAVREVAIKRLDGIGVAAPARLVDSALGVEHREQQNDDLQGRPIVFGDPEPWPESVDGAALLNELTAFYSRHLVLPEHGAQAVTLWTVHTYALAVIEISPYLAITSPELRCGKTLLLELLGMLVSRPLLAANVTGATVFRAIDRFEPTLLIDEADTFLADRDDLRGLLNSGHRRGTAFVLRNVGDDHEPRLFSTWAAKAVAMIGRLPRTLEDRSIEISMRRKKRGEKVERFRRGKVEAECQALRRKIVRWVRDHKDILQNADPGVPDALNDRAQDNWGPLQAIADAAGENWPERARKAALSLSGPEKEVDSSIGIQLLADLGELFGLRGVEKLETQEIIKALSQMDERPWPGFAKGKPITPQQIAKLLKPYKIEPKQIWTGEKGRGYDFADFADAFTRYVPVPGPVGAVDPNSNRAPRPSREAVGESVPTTSENGQKLHEYDVLPYLPDEMEQSGAEGEIVEIEEETV